jgi:2-polyprenyl-3-methyl-5-hydroxy-6-metoxy-1,4-benzoquinol methylase
MVDRMPEEKLRATKLTPYSRMRHALARVVFLRSGYFLLRAIWEAMLDSPARGETELNHEFAPLEDPWSYASAPCHVYRISREVEMLDAVRGDRRFEKAMEVGCAEGLFTEKLAPLCDSLLAADISSVALARARRRLQAYEQVQFAHWDLRVHPVQGIYDLIVTVHALEYVRNPFYIRRAREKLVNSLRPGGYLLIGTMKVGDIYEDSWWGRFFLRSGKRINDFFAAHPALKVIETEDFKLGNGHVAFDVLLRREA